MQNEPILTLKEYRKTVKHSCIYCGVVADSIMSKGYEESTSAERVSCYKCKKSRLVKIETLEVIPPDDKGNELSPLE